MQLIHGMDHVSFDLLVARKYKHKRDNAIERDLSFSLTFAQFRHIFTRKNCAYTGIPMTVSLNQIQSDTDLTVERVDNNKGYEVGNVIAVCKAANAFKGVLENPQCLMNVKHGIKMFTKIADLQKKIK